MIRPKLKQSDMSKAIDDIIDMLDVRLKQHGPGICASQHEIKGIYDEEVGEYHEAVHENDHSKQREELIDTAVACILGIASIDSGEMDW